MGSHRNDIWLAEASPAEMRGRLKEAGYSPREVDSADEAWLHHRLEKQFEYERHQEENEDDEGDDDDEEDDD